MAQPIRKYDICIGRVDKNNPDKKYWDKIGEGVVWPADGGGERMSGRLFHIPETQIVFFEQKERSNGAPSNTPVSNAPVATADNSNDEINIEDIPF